MSWHRRQGDIRRKFRSGYRHAGNRQYEDSQPSRVEAFPVVRPVSQEVAISLAGLLPQTSHSLQEKNIGRTSQPVLRQFDSTPSVCLMGFKEMKLYSRDQWPADKNEFIEELAEVTKTSNQTMYANFENVGFFGSKFNDSVAIKIGLTFDEETTERLKQERYAVADILEKDSTGKYKRYYPHLSIGQVAVPDEIRNPFKRELQHLSREIGQIALLPVRPSYPNPKM